MSPRSILDSLPQIDRLLIVRLGSMGDIIHSLPAATVLRKAYPNTQIGWVVEERWSELLCSPSESKAGPVGSGRPLVNRLHPVTTKEWRKSLFSIQTLSEIGSRIQVLRSGRYEVAVDLQGAARSAIIARCSGATSIVGSEQPRESVASMFYTRIAAIRGRHVIEHNMGIAESVTRRASEVPKVEFPRDKMAELYVENLLEQQSIPNFAVINPGAGWGAKLWPAERYGEVARALADVGLASLVNFGPGEGILARAVETSSKGAAESVSCSISQLIALMRRAKLFIGGDTGPMHLAAALHVPVVALFGPTDPGRNGPFGTASVVLRNESSVTSHARVAETEAGLLEITAQEVVAAAESLLRTQHRALV